MGSPFAVARLMPTGHGKQTKFRVHVLVTGSFADADTIVFQQNSHYPVARNAFALMIGFGYASQNFRLISPIPRFSVLQIIVVGVRKICLTF